MVYFSFLHYTSLCISCDKNLVELLMLCSVLWASCFSFFSIKFYVCTWVDLLFVNRGYREPFAVTTPILDHKDGHYVRLNKVVFKYLDFKKNVDLNVDFRVFNSVAKANVKTSEEYIINAFNYMLKDMTSNWCHNYMLKFLDCIFLKLT
jgi:hypothetical protein